MNKKFYLGLLAVSVLAGCKDSSSTGNDSNGGDGGDLSQLIGLEIQPMTELMSGNQRTAIVPMGYPTEFKALAVYQDGTRQEVNASTWEAGDFLRFVEGHSNIFDGFNPTDDSFVLAEYSKYSAEHPVEIRSIGHKAFQLDGSAVVLKGFPSQYAANLVFNEPGLPNKTLNVNSVSSWQSDNADILEITDGVANAKDVGSVTISTHFEYGRHNEEMQRELTVIALDEIDEITFKLDAGFSNPQNSAQRVLLENRPEELKAVLDLNYGKEKLKIDVSDDTAWSASGNCEIDENNNLVTHHIGSELNDCTVTGVYNNVQLEQPLTEEMQLTTLGKDNFANELVVECAQNPFYGSTECEAMLEVAKGEMQETLHVREVADWTVSNSTDFSVDNKGKVSSEAIGKSTEVTASLANITGATSLTVGLPVNDIEIIVDNSDGQPEILADGQLTLLAMSGEEDISSLVVWTVSNENAGTWTINEDGKLEATGVVKGDSASITATYKYKNDVESSPIEVTVAELEVCTLGEENRACLYVTEDELGNAFTSTPNTVVTSGLSIPVTGQQLDKDDNEYGFVNWNNINKWCDKLNNLAFEGKVWSVPSETELKALYDDSKVDGDTQDGMFAYGWATEKYYWTSTQANVNGNLFNKIARLSGSWHVLQNGDKTNNSGYYASCIAR